MSFSSCTSPTARVTELEPTPPSVPAAAGALAFPASPSFSTSPSLSSALLHPDLPNLHASSAVPARLDSQPQAGASSEESAASVYVQLSDSAAGATITRRASVGDVPASDVQQLSKRAKRRAERRLLATNSLDETRTKPTSSHVSSVPARTCTKRWFDLLHRYEKWLLQQDQKEFLSAQTAAFPPVFAGIGTADSHAPGKTGSSRGRSERPWYKSRHMVIMAAGWIAMFIVLAILFYLNNLSAWVVDDSGDAVRPIVFDCETSLFNSTTCGSFGRGCIAAEKNIWRPFRCLSRCSWPSSGRRRVVGGVGANPVYRGDSSVCAAALHQGILTGGSGGCGFYRPVCILCIHRCNLHPWFIISTY